MKIIDQLEEFRKPKYAVVTIGTFDGVHMGHQTILRQLVADAKKNGGRSILITFWPHPCFILDKAHDKPKLLSTFDEKVQLVKEIGVDYLIKIPFTLDFSNMSAEEFVRKILIEKIRAKKLYVGYDHRFGNNQEGNIKFLRSQSSIYDFEVQEIRRQDIHDIAVSSTKIRNALLKGEIHLAKSLLGRNYSITGRVVHGNQTGRTIGFPTANIEVPEPYKLLPVDGSYVAIAKVDGKDFKAMLNIGFKPTVNGTKRTIEIHLFNFDAQIYDKTVDIKFMKLLRNEMKFDSIDHLKEQLQLDKEKALKILS